MANNSTPRSHKGKTDKNWRDYERAMFNHLYYVYRPPHFIVLPDYKEVKGMITKRKRQIDVVVLNVQDKTRPILAVESKYYTRKLNVKDVEAFIGMQQDIGSREAVMVAPFGFSATAQRRVQGTNITLLTLPPQDAERLNWRDLIRETFLLDESFHPGMGDAVHLFDNLQEQDTWKLMDIMAMLPFEEWGHLFGLYRALSPQRCRAVLEQTAADHYNQDWVFNAVRLLDEYHWLDNSLVNELFHNHRIDGDLYEYLCDTGYIQI
jgi:hypothetical protein